MVETGAAVDTGEVDGQVVSYDGRRARRDRNSESVIRACWQLFAEGEMYPSAQQVAERSGVSLRSVFRHFQNLEALVRTATAAYYREHIQVFEPPVIAPGASLEDRVEAMVAFRLRQYAVTGVVMRGAIARSASDHQLGGIVDESRRRAIAVVEYMFADELDAAPPARRATMVAALHTATLFETWHNLVHVHGLTNEQAADVYRGLLRGALSTGA